MRLTFLLKNLRKVETTKVSFWLQVAQLLLKMYHQELQIAPNMRIQLKKSQTTSEQGDSEDANCILDDVSRR